MQGLSCIYHKLSITNLFLIKIKYNNQNISFKNFINQNTYKKKNDTCQILKVSSTN